MNPGFDATIIARRKAHVTEALEARQGYGNLAGRWNITIVAARDWCMKYLGEDDCLQLAENGRLRVHRTAANVGDRLALVEVCRAAGWTDRRIAAAIGITRSGLCEWLKRNAPDGLQDALEDFHEEEAA